MEKIKTRGVMKFLHLKGYSAQKIYDEMKDVYGDEDLSYITLTYWGKKFQTGHIPLTDEPKSGPSVRPLPAWLGPYYNKLLNKLRDALKIQTLGYAYQRCPSPC